LPRQPRPTPPNTLNLTTFNEPLNDNKKDKISSPSDKLSHKLISPNLVQSVRCSSPVIHNVENNVLSPIQDAKILDNLKNGSLDTSKSTTPGFVRSSGKFISTSNFHQNNLSVTSPVLPDIRNIVAENHGIMQNVKTPPPPPPRWAKPGMNQNQSNFTVTTTVTFNMDHSNDINSSQVRKKFFFEIF